MTKKDLTYNEAVQKIEEILNKLENDELSIDELTNNIRLASELMKFCKNKLRETEIEVERILENIDGEENQ